MAYLKRSTDRQGWTYLIQGVDGGPVKIGRTLSDPQERLRSIAANSPIPLRIVLLIRSVHHEHDLHERFSDRRLHFEWFDESVIPEIISAYETDAHEREQIRRTIATALAEVC